MTKEMILLSRLCEAYYRHKGLRTMELSALTPAYSQRFGEWREFGIVVEKQPDAEHENQFIYCLRTDPATIDILALRLRVPEQRTKPKGKQIEKGEEQIGMKL